MEWVTGLVITILLFLGGLFGYESADISSTSNRDTSQVASTTVNKDNVADHTANTKIYEDKTYRNNELKFEFQYPTKPGSRGYFLEPIKFPDLEKSDPHTDFPWLLALVFCMDYGGYGSCGMGSGEYPDFGVQRYSGQNLSADNLGSLPDTSPFLIFDNYIEIDGHPGRSLRWKAKYHYDSDATATIRQINLIVKDKLVSFGIYEVDSANSAMFDSIVGTLNFY